MTLQQTVTHNTESLLHKSKASAIKDRTFLTGAFLKTNKHPHRFFTKEFGIWPQEVAAADR